MKRDLESETLINKFNQLTPLEFDLLFLSFLSVDSFLYLGFLKSLVSDYKTKTTIFQFYHYRSLNQWRKSHNTNYKNKQVKQKDFIPTNLIKLAKNYCLKNDLVSITSQTLDKEYYKNRFERYFHLTMDKNKVGIYRFHNSKFIKNLSLFYLDLFYNLSDLSF